MTKLDFGFADAALGDAETASTLGRIISKNSKKANQNNGLSVIEYTFFYRNKETSK